LELNPAIEEAVKAAETFWDSLSLQSEERVKKFKEMVNNPELYRWEDIESEFGKTDGFDEIAPILQESFDT